MSACEKCWRDANARMLMLGGSVSDHYRDLLDERRDNPCPAVEEPEADPARVQSVEPAQGIGSATDTSSITGVLVSRITREDETNDDAR
jgi:hypothetical protein